MKIKWVCMAAWLVPMLAGAAAEMTGTPAQAAAAQDAYLAEGYKLVWSDEFDQPGRPDAAKWTYETGFVRNEELQWYQPENARVENGMLVIEGKRERKVNPNYQQGATDWKKAREFADYTSASLTTKGLHSWLHGRFEMRGRIDTRAGLWPAWWTLGVEGRWPAGGEIDIMEYYRGILLANVAWASDNPRKPAWASTRTPLKSLGDGWSGKFHVWRMDWDEQAIKLYCDGQELNCVELARTINQDDGHKNPFRAAQYMILNLAIGGKAGGDPSKTKFPGRFMVDYVRVYQKGRTQTRASHRTPCFCLFSSTDNRPPTTIPLLRPPPSIPYAASGSM